MGVWINEVLFDPEGEDKSGEFVELFNNGSLKVDLAGWSLKDKSGKIFKMEGLAAPAEGYLVLDYKTTGISLNNSDEELYLYQGDKIIDKAVLDGKAERGMSLARQGNGSFVFTAEITAGEANAKTKIFEGDLREGRIEGGGGGAGFLAGMIAAGLIFGVLAVWVYRSLDESKKDE